MRAKIRTLSNHTIIEKETVFGQPVFGLNAQELIRDVSGLLDWFVFHNTARINKSTCLFALSGFVESSCCASS
jgi:hypothetical protein